MSKSNRTVTERFWAKVVKSVEPGACWLWTGAKNSNGYGHMWNGELTARGNTKLVNAHRLSYELANGAIPDGMMIDHTCHVKNCVRPDHLRLATRKENAENRAGAAKNSTTGVRGIYRNGSGWQAEVCHNGKRHYGGTYKTIEEAAEVARQLRLRLFTHNDQDRQTANEIQAVTA